MALNNVTFIKGQGGLGRQPLGKDYVSGFIFFDGTKPSGFISAPYVKKLLSLSDAETYGINRLYGDETKASASYKVTNKGASGDTMEIVVTDYTGATSLGTYVNGTNAGVNDAATAIQNFINAGTYSHGYTAIATTDTIAIKPPAGKGLALNTGTPITISITGTLAGTLTQFGGGVASKLAQYWYQISEYFRMQPNGELWVLFADVPSTYDFTEINTLLNESIGEVRQFSIFANGKTAITTGDLGLIDAIIKLADVTYGPSSCLYSCDITALGTGTNALASLPDLSALTYNKVSVVVEQSLSGYSYTLYKTTGKSVPGLGTALGTLALSNVADDIAEVGKYNISDGVEHETAGFSNGQLFKDVSVPLQNNLNGYRYIFGRKFIGYSGTYWNDDHASVSITSDYAYIDDNRVIDKAIRLTKLALLPRLNSKLKLNADGTLADFTIRGLEGLIRESLNEMVRNDEISAFSPFISPAQNVLSTSKIIVIVQIVKQGIARNIEVHIGYTQSL